MTPEHEALCERLLEYAADGTAAHLLKTEAKQAADAIEALSIELAAYKDAEPEVTEHLYAVIAECGDLRSRLEAAEKAMSAAPKPLR